MRITIDTKSAVPPYEQIRQQIRRLIAQRRLADGARLPTIAQLANDLGLAAGTVARAYRELEGEGLVVSTRRRGTFVTDPHRTPARPNAADIEAVASDFALRVRQLGIDPERALRRARQLLD